MKPPLSGDKLNLDCEDPEERADDTDRHEDDKNPGDLDFVLNELIDKIEVHQAEKVNGVWRQRLTIHYNCVGVITLPDTATIQAPHVTMNTRQGVYVTYEPDTPSPAAETASA